MKPSFSFAYIFSKTYPPENYNCRSLYVLLFVESDKRNEEKAKLQNEKTKLEKKVDELESQVQQHSTHLSSFVPAQG